MAYNHINPVIHAQFRFQDNSFYKKLNNGGFWQVAMVESEKRFVLGTFKVPFLGEAVK